MNRQSGQEQEDETVPRHVSPSMTAVDNVSFGFTTILCPDDDCVKSNQRGKKTVKHSLGEGDTERVNWINFLTGTQARRNWLRLVDRTTDEGLSMKPARTGVLLLGSPAKAGRSSMERQQHTAEQKAEEER